MAMSDELSVDQLVGKASDALIPLEHAVVHKDIIDDWQALCRLASAEGFDLAIASGYRSFDRQLVIWNEKVTGVRPLLGARGETLDIKLMQDKERVFSILRWSAIPGGSRHHWGTDLDIYDRAAVSSDYVVQLIADEVKEEAVFGPLHSWLDSRIEAGAACGFYRPYTGLSGVAEEKWHLSHKATSQCYSRQLSERVLYEFLAAEPGLLLREAVLENFAEIFLNYVCCYEQ